MSLYAENREVYLELSALPDDEIRRQLGEIKQGVCGDRNFSDLSFFAQGRAVLRRLRGDRAMTKLQVGVEILKQRQGC